MVDRALLTQADLVNIKLNGDNLVAFKNDWDIALSQLDTVPDNQFLENLLYKQLQKSDRFRSMLTLYQNDHLLSGIPRDYSRLYMIFTKI